MEIIKFKDMYSSVHWTTILLSDINLKGKTWYLEQLLRYRQWIRKPQDWFQHLHIDVNTTYSIYIPFPTLQGIKRKLKIELYCAK